LFACGSPPDIPRLKPEGFTAISVKLQISVHDHPIIERESCCLFLVPDQFKSRGEIAILPGAEPHVQINSTTS
jgi:hypothetical protein